MKNAHSILALYENASLSVKEWHDLTLEMVGKCDTPEEAQRLHQQFELAEIAARVSNDAALETNFREGKLRLKVFLALWSRALEKGKTGPKQLSDTDVGKLKADQLARAGISERTAERYEELLGCKDKQAEGIAAEATELYLAQQRDKQEPGTMKGLLKAVKSSIDAAFPPAPKNGAHTKPVQKDEPLSAAVKASFDWHAWMMDIDDLQPELAADGEHEQFAQSEFDRSERASGLIARFQAQLKKRHHVTTKASSTAGKSTIR